jgi:hypothetical protein
MTMTDDASTVKRLCIGCYRLYPPGDVHHNLRGYQCVCVGCDAVEASANETSGEDTTPTRRHET